MTHVYEISSADWLTLKMLKECFQHYQTLPYPEREKFKIAERKEKLMFKGIISENVREVAA